MSNKILQVHDPTLEIETFLPKVAAPKVIEVDDGKLHRVARPLRNVRHIPTKAQVFHSMDGPIEFSYEDKIRLPVSKNKLVVEVHYVGLNPVDKKIRNGYETAIYGEVGLGREYSGIISHVGKNLQEQWCEGDEVFGIYYHPHLAVGCSKSSILVDPKVDPILIKPQNISEPVAAGSMFCIGTAFNLLDKLQKSKSLTSQSNILINGGTSSVSMAAIQLLKNYFQVDKRLVIVTTGSSADKLEEYFPSLGDDLIFVDYLSCRGKASKPLKKMIEEKRVASIENRKDKQIVYNEGKFDIVLDFIGGYDILSSSSSLIHSGGVYLTIVGDYVANYKKDIFNSWDNPSANARKMFGSMLWSYNYIHFYFDPNAKTASSNDWIRKCGEFLEDGTVKVIVDKQYDWKNAKEAFSYMSTQRAQGKLILKVEKF